jgi:hypothetical protein
VGGGGVLTRGTLTRADVEYITEHFVRLEDACRRRGDDPEAVRAEIARGRLPRPTYVLDDGTEMVPPDYFRLVEDAGGIERLHDHFVAAFRAAGGSPEEAEGEWSAYLTGEYGACLREVTPAHVVRKDDLVRRVETLLAEPRPVSAEWREQLRASVDELDQLEREFAPYDRIRFGGPVSRDRLITAVRERYASIFAHEPAPGMAL